MDDTDGLDPAGEFDAWRARELARLLRDKQAQAARDEEREEIERRRAMPEEQRLREDMEYAEQTRAREKTQMGFLQKYYHKGAFHQDDDLLKRDYTAATESQVDMSMLPKVMQVRDFGKVRLTAQLWLRSRTCADRADVADKVYPSYGPGHDGWRMGHGGAAERTRRCTRDDRNDRYGVLELRRTALAQRLPEPEHQRPARHGWCTGVRRRCCRLWRRGRGRHERELGAARLWWRVKPRRGSLRRQR